LKQYERKDNELVLTGAQLYAITMYEHSKFADYVAHVSAHEKQHRTNYWEVSRGATDNDGDYVPDKWEGDGSIPGCPCMHFFIGSKDTYNVHHVDGWSEFENSGDQEVSAFQAGVCKQPTVHDKKDWSKDGKQDP
jgi:hypothetical protein